jgi:hypothetical protein
MSLQELKAWLEENIEESKEFQRKNGGFGMFCDGWRHGIGLAMEKIDSMLARENNNEEEVVARLGIDED